MSWINTLFCNHNYKLDYEQKTNIYEDMFKSSKIPKRIIVTRLYLCNKCGNIKKITLDD